VGPDLAYGVGVPLERPPFLRRDAASKRLSDFRAEPSEKFRPESARIAPRRRSPAGHHLIARWSAGRAGPRRCVDHAM